MFNITNKVINYGQVSGKSLWIVVTLCLFFILWVTTETSSHSWAGDFSQYIHHAMNLVDGKAYADTGYIPNTFAFVGPPAYPPVFPVLLAVVYAIFGFNLFAFKVTVAVCFFTALYFSINMLTEKLSKAHQLVFIVILALSPYFWLVKSQIWSDFLFMLIVYVTLFVLNKRYIKTDNGYSDVKNKNWGYAALIGLLLYLNYSTREIGIVFIPTILCFELFHFRKISLSTGFALLIFIALTTVGHKLIDPPVQNHERTERITTLAESYGHHGTDISHIGLFTTDLSRIIKQVTRYVRAIRYLWPDSASKLVYIASTLALLLFLVFVAGGYLRAVYIGPGLLEIFSAGYIAVLLLFGGFEGLRYMIPLIPILFLYCFKMHEELLKTKYKTAMLFISAVFLASTTISYASNNYFSNDWKLGIINPYAEDFFDYVKKSTPKDSVFVFTKPRILALFTERQAAAIPGRPYPKNTESLVKYMKAIGAAYLVHSAVEINGMHSAVNGLDLPQDKFLLAYTNKYFYLYKLTLK